MFKLSPVPFSPLRFAEKMRHPAAGGFVSFEGWVRDHHDGRKVLALEYEALEPLCDSEAQKIFAQAKERFEVLDIVCVHRTGRLSVGEMAVWAGVMASHRDAAFKACRYVIDELKRRLPIWKKEFYTDGQSEWVNCQYVATDLPPFRDPDAADLKGIF